MCSKQARPSVQHSMVREGQLWTFAADDDRQLTYTVESVTEGGRVGFVGSGARCHADYMAASDLWTLVRVGAS